MQNYKEKIKTSIKSAKKKFYKSEQAPKDQMIFIFNVAFEVVKSLIYFLVVLGLLGGAFAGGIGLGYFAYLVSDTKVPNKQELENKINDVEQLSTITYAGGEKIADIKSDLIRTSVVSENMSPILKNALVATEDEYFQIHKGIVPKAVIRALVSDATGLGGSSGGSTITQQLVKQQVLTSETSYKRKANEIVLALHLEKFFSKDEIITAYLNVSPFGRNNKGQNIAGVQEAAKGIFNTTAKELSLPQAAYIAGLPQSPITYSPYTNTGEIKEDNSFGMARKDQVLYNMYKEEYISKQEYDDAKAYDLAQDFRATENISDETNGFLYHYAHQQAVEILMPTFYEKDGLKKEDLANNDDLYNKYYQIAERELRRDGYTVQTTIDKTVYAAMQQAEQDYSYILNDGREATLFNSSVLLDNQTGRIIAFVGGRDYNSNQNNNAFQSRRSPGSTIKPILAYAPAIDVGLIGTESKLSNFSRKYKDGNNLTNYGGAASSGFKSVRDALKVSDNVPVVELYQELIKVADPKEYYKKMNIPMTDEEFYNRESIPVGGTDTGPTVLEQTNAFATLANKGQFAQGYSIEKITDMTGKVIYEHKLEPVPVFSPATASIMNDMMRDVITSGTGTDATGFLYNMGSGVANADWVGKTGTSQDFKDFWFIASTPGITISSWIGYDELYMYEGWDRVNKQLWAYLTNAAYQAKPELFKIDERFVMDPSVIKAKVSNVTGQKTGTATVDGYQRSVPGKEVVSLWATKGPTNSQFRFGLGGTDAQYKSIWDSSYVKPKPKPTTPSTNNQTDKKEEEKKEADKKEEVETIFIEEED